MVLVQIWQIQFLFKSLSFYRVIIVAADSYYKVWWVSQLLPIERCRLNDWKLESWLLAVETWSQRRWHASEIQRVHTDGDSRSTVSQWFHKINVFLLLEDRFAASVIPPTYPLPKHADTICVLDLCQITFNLTHHWCIKLPVVSLYTGTSFWQVLPFLNLCAMCPTHPCQVLAVKSWILRTTYRCSCLTLRFAFCLPNKSQSHRVF